MRLVVYILVAIFLLTVLLDKALHSIPPKELRRRARTKHDKRAAALFRLTAFGYSSSVFIRLIGILSVSGIVVAAVQVAWWVGFLVIVVAMWLVWTGRPKTADAWDIRVAAVAAPVLTPVVALLHPLLGRLFFWHRRSMSNPPTGIYEKEDLLEFLKLQARQVDNRIPGEDLKLTGSALRFADKSVAEVMLPRRKIRWVAAGDPISPMVMDELHDTGQQRFPVVKEVVKTGNPEILGTLYIKDLLDHLEDKGKIRDIMRPGAGFINESQNLHGALDGFLKSGQYLLVVVNDFEEVVGALALEDVLELVFGQKFSTDFGNYQDIRAAASDIGNQSGGQPNKAEVE